MNKIKNMIWFVMLGLYFSCSSSGSAPQKSTAYKVDYEEDLSVYRTTYDYKAEEPNAAPVEKPVTITQPENPVRVDNDLSVTQELDHLLSEVAEKNKKVKNIRGYTIQVFSGNNREIAEKAKRQVYHLLPEARPEVKFSPPIYKVLVGQYADPLEAQKTFSILKKEFPSATINPDWIQINN